MNRIKELRIAAGKSQAELADIIGVNKQAISQYERGVRYPRPEIMEALTDYFNVSTEYLMGKTEVSPLLITPDERRFLDTYRRLDEYRRRLADTMLTALEDDSKQ